MNRMFRIWAALAALCVSAIPAPAESGRRALLIGINIYKWSGAVHKDPALDFQNLAGAAGDAIWLKSILTSKYGFRAQDVIVLTNAAATRDAVIRSFRSHLIANSAPGDAALFYFAGHGSQRGGPASADAAADIEETLVPADSRDPDGKVFDITSSELHTLFLALLEKTQNVTSILDSCHSGTAVRDIARGRSIAADKRARPATAFLSGVQTRGLSSALDPIAPVVRISAARADQESEEYTEFTAQGKAVPHGLMSFHLFRELEAAGGSTTWRDVMDRTRTEVAKRSASQDPQLDAVNPDTLLFGGAGLAATEPWLLVTPQRHSVLLNAGAMHTMASGTGLDVYPPGTHEFTGEPLARLTVTKVADFTSEATVVSGAAAKDLPEGARAVIRSRPVTDFQFGIFFESENPLVGSVREEALHTIKGATESTRALADAVVRFEAGSIHTERKNGMVMSPPVPAADADAVSHVVRQLSAWARWQQLLDAKGSEPVLSLSVTGAKGESLTQVADGDTITLELCNKGNQPYFTRVIYFSSAGSVKPLDLTTDGAPLRAGQCGTGGSFVITTEDGRMSGVEFFKAFATLDKIDPEPFIGTEVRGDVADPAQWSSVTKALTVFKR